MPDYGRVIDRERDGRCRPRWSDEEIIAALRLWHERYGTWPRYEHWHRGSARYSAERHGAPGRGQRGEFPAAPVVIRRFGSWRQGLEAAGA